MRTVATTLLATTITIMLLTVTRILVGAPPCKEFRLVRLWFYQRDLEDFRGELILHLWCKHKNNGIMPSLRKECLYVEI